MHPLHRLEVENFLSLQDVKVDFGPLNVLAGPNGAGKSNLLKVLGFLGDVVRLDLWQAIQSHGGFSALRFRGERRTGNTIRIRLTGQFSKDSASASLDSYSLECAVEDLIRPDPTSEPWPDDKLSPVSLARFRTIELDDNKLQRTEQFSFARPQGGVRNITLSGEAIEFVNSAGVPDRRELDAESSGLSTLPRLGKAEGADEVAALAALLRTFRVFEIDADAARQPSANGKSTQLQPNASNLASFLTYLSEKHPETFADLEDDLARMIPGVKKIHLRPVGGAIAGSVIELGEAGLSGRTPLGAASLGTIRALALLAMLHDPSPPKLTCVEEIDHGLHPYAFDLLVERLREASERTQLLVVTHSPVLVNRLEPEELIVCERDPETGASDIPAIDSESVRKMEQAGGDFRLGELWFSGMLRGVPA